MTESRDPGAHSQGAVFANNFCKGFSSLVDSRVIQSANIHTPDVGALERTDGSAQPDPTPIPDPIRDPIPEPIPDRGLEPTPEVGVLRTSDRADGSNPAPLQSGVLSGDECVFLDDASRPDR